MTGPVNGIGVPIAVIGLAGRFPGAEDVSAFWRLLVERGDAIGPVPTDRWDTAAPLDPVRHVQDVGGFLPDVDLFDPVFFGISPREAGEMDPQQRMMLEATWRALEDAGVPAAQLRGRHVGVYVGASWHDYELLRKDRDAPPTQHSMVGNVLDGIAARVSYALRVTGPSLTVESGCSSSLVALHLAVQALRSGETDACLVGGVNLMLTPDNTIGLTHFGGLSPTGRCRAFAAAADGFVRGEGVIALYLKRLDRALADGDHVHGVVVQTAVNNDGGGESLVTPNPTAQEELLRSAYRQSGVPIDEVAYIEAHGTGTRRGDPIEARAIGRVLGVGRTSGPLAIGSVKTNIGHLEPAAGLAGLVKALLSLRHRVVPPSLHSDELNPDIDFDALNLHVVREPWPLPPDGPVYVGVNSFGWGGTNAHAILAPPPPPPARSPVGATPVPDRATPVVLPLSAHQPGALREQADQLARLAPTVDVAELAGTLAWRRDQFDLRAAVVARDAAEAATLLTAYARDPDAEIDGVVSGRAGARGRTAFVFPGQGSQWPGLGAELYAQDPVFAAAIDRCAKALCPYVDWDPRRVVAGRDGDGWLDRLDMVQPVLWAVSVALAELWKAHGVEPDVVIGHSQGEIAAATVAGILSLDDAARVVATRSRLVARTAGRGGMLAVELAADRAERALTGYDEAVSVAVDNGPRSCVLSGDVDALAAVRARLEADGAYCRPVYVDYAAHSPQMDPLADELLAALQPIRPRVGATPLMSTVEVAMMSGTELDAGYWMRNLRRPVLFADAMEAVLADGIGHVIEISAHPLLSTAVEELAEEYDDPARVLFTLRRGCGGGRDFALALARAFTAGLAPFRSLPAARVALPAYPWQRSRFWVPEGHRRSRPAEIAPALLPSAAEQGVWSGTTRLDVDGHPWLLDHRVHDAVAVPGVAMLALGLGAARSRLDDLPATLDGVRFHADLTLGAAPTVIGAEWRDDGTEGGTLTLRSLPPGESRWTTHATARMRLRPAEEPLGTFPDRMLAEPACDIPRFYAACAERGLTYGSAFRTLTALYVSEADGGRAALGEVRLAEHHPDLCPGLPHPTIWDGALQTVLALHDGAHAAVPTGVRRIVIHGRPDAPVRSLWSHAVQRDAAEFDLYLYDAQRAPLITMEGLRTQVIGAGSDDSDADRRYWMRFVPAPRGDVPPPRGTWLVHGDHTRAGGLAAALRAAGAHTTVTVDPAAVTDDVAGIAYLAPCRDLPAQRRGLLDLAELVRAGAARPVPPRLVVLTADAQAVTDDDRTDPGGALFWGFARVVMREHPELRTLALDAASYGDAWGPVAAEILADDGEDQAVLRGADRYVGRLTCGPAPERQAPVVPWRSRPQPFRLATDRPGLFEALCYRPKVRTSPPPGQVEIEVTAAGVNFIDVVKAMGTYPDTVDVDLFGNECAGTVTAVGVGVCDVAVGDRVVAAAPGAMSSHVTVRADHVQPIPIGMSDVDAATVPVVQLTAWHGLNDLARLAAGETVLIHSAAGGLGLAAVGVARLLGARVIATAGTRAKREYLHGLGIEHVFDSRDLAWVTGVRAATAGRGVDVVLNSLAGAAIEQGLAVLAEDGRFIEVGKVDIYGGRSIGLSEFRKRVSFASVDLSGMARNRPERFARLFAEVWTLVTTGKLPPVPVTAFPFSEAVDALRAMSTGHHVGKFVLTDPGGVESVCPQPIPFRADATYVVTGGLGALGLSFAEFLADGGAGSLALFGRSAPGPAAAARVEALRGRGVRVAVLAVDVADRHRLDAALAEVRATAPQIRGVVHAAGLLDDATIGTLDGDSLRRVLAPKVDGAVNLDRATAPDPLDFFLLFSSMAALVGNAGQAAYAAGNAYLDALAVARRQRGLPALSVQWGPFAEVGLAAADSIRGDRLSARGMGSFTTAEAWPVLRRLLTGDERVVGYAPIELPRWFESYPETAAQASWRELREVTDRGGPGQRSGGEFASWLRSVDAAARTTAACDKVRELAGRVLGLDGGTIEPETAFRTLGLDSLMSVELRNRVESTFGVKLSPTALWTHRTSRALAVELCRRIE